jgi:hypothetical protein
VAALVVTVARVRRTTPGERRAALLLFLVAAGAAAILALAAGPYGPWESRLWVAARKLVKPYAMIRQTAKICVLLPSLVAVALALSFRLLAALPRPARLAAAALAGLMILDYRAQVHATVAVLDRAQGAYAAVAADAAKLGQVPRALVLPLWPGDSHYTSVYLHHAATYRIRMLNGYRPFVAESYREAIFRSLAPMNMGYITEASLRQLTDRGVRWIVLHEDLFPEKVSPFPVMFTLRNLLNHPRLELLAHDGPVWAFAIREARPAKPVRGADWTYLFPGCTVQAEKAARTAGAPPAIGRDPAAGGGAYATLEAGGALRMGPFACPPADGLRWIVRARGHGTLRLGHAGGVPKDTALDTNDWAWIGCPLPPTDGLVTAELTLEASTGRLEVDLAILTAGPWPSPAPGEALAMPAACFFHAGTLDPDSGAVVFRAGRDRPDLVFYGPKLPVPPGNYEVALEFNTPHPATTAGEWIVASPEGREVARMTVRGGPPARLAFTLADNAPLLMGFDYRGTTDITIRRVVLTRAASAAASAPARRGPEPGD